MSLFRGKNKFQLKVKICGIANETDILSCANLGVHALGFLLGDSKSNTKTDYLTTERAKNLISKVPSHMKSVLLLKESNFDQIIRLVDKIKPDVIQLQSEYLHQDVLARLHDERQNFELIKTFRVRDNDTVESLLKSILPVYNFIDAILLDSIKGGSGISHNWALSRIIARYLIQIGKPFILAGGLTVENIQVAINTVNPSMIDLMSGVSIDKGVKDISKISQLMSIIQE